MLRRWLKSRFVSIARTSPLSQSVKHVDSRVLSLCRFHTSTISPTDIIPLRKQLKDAARANRGQKTTLLTEDEKLREEQLLQWELTVGIEIHAQLNTSHKLFSHASAEYTDVPNAASWPFDLAIPGTQPIFQHAVLLPALRAALALECDIQLRSRFDRKHYFYHDQPAGYQITQYYEPFAKNGKIVLTEQDGLKIEDGGRLEIGIKQVQLEQDTAKTQEQDEETSLIDFNRAGHALIEIISLPQLHSPEAAAAYVKKVQSILYAVDSATTGMELGGLRADVNVSVRKIGDVTGNHSYGGVSGLGQRTEIKNLSSFKSVEDAVRAERDRQIRVLESGGMIEGETRGWSLSNPSVTRRLRGKEGEVDYRYMPDPDIAPLYIAHDLLLHLQRTLPPVPEQLLDMLQSTYKLTLEDARALLSLDNGERLLYYQDVVSRVIGHAGQSKDVLGVQIGNWLLHELGALLTTTETPWRSDLIRPQQMADLVLLQSTGKLTGTSAKQLLRILFNGDKDSVAHIVERESLLFMPMSDEEYGALAAAIIKDHPIEAGVVRQNDKQAKGKLKFLLGQMMRQGDRNRIEARRAERELQTKLCPSNS